MFNSAPGYNWTEYPVGKRQSINSAIRQSYAADRCLISSSWLICRSAQHWTTRSRPETLRVQTTERRCMGERRPFLCRWKLGDSRGIPQRRFRPRSDQGVRITGRLEFLRITGGICYFISCSGGGQTCSYPQTGFSFWPEVAVTAVTLSEMLDYGGIFFILTRSGFTNIGDLG
jgi:hypothetical protein